METQVTEQALRREAIRRRLQGETRQAICRDLNRSTRWFDKWWAEYQCHPTIDFTDGSRAPHTSPQAIPAPVRRAVVKIRRVLEAGKTPETKYGLIGARAILGQLECQEIAPLPSTATIQRILAAAELTHPVGAGSAKAYYPWPQAWAVNAIHATDIITRYLRGGQEIQNFHTLDHFSYAAHITQHLDKSSTTARAHLLEAWTHLGLPLVQQFDNEEAFRGGHTHPRVIGQVVRLCLFCGIEPFFIPIYEAKRNYQVETFHSLWTQAFWSRQTFRHLEHVQTESPIFLDWYLHRYRPPELEGQTPAQVRHEVPIVRLTAYRQQLIPSGRLPITAGRIHIMRKIDPSGHVSLLNERWYVDSDRVGEYVRATLNTATETLSFWFKQDDETDWRLIRKRIFRFQEPVHDLLPEFRRNRARCRDCWPD